MERQEFRRKMPPCAIFDFKGVEKELTEMAAQGWQLEQVHINRQWIYRKTEPAAKQFAVVFCKDARYFLYGESRSQEELEEACARQGWEKVGQWAKMIIFSADEGTAMPLETDEYARLQSVKYSMKNTMIWFSISTILDVLFFMLLGIVIVKNIGREEVYYDIGLHIFYLILGCIAIPVSIGEIAGYFKWIKKSEEGIETGTGFADADKISKLVHYGNKCYLWFVTVTFLLSITLYSFFGVIFG